MFFQSTLFSCIIIDAKSHKKNKGLIQSCQIFFSLHKGFISPIPKRASEPCEDVKQHFCGVCIDYGTKASSIKIDGRYRTIGFKKNPYLSLDIFGEWNEKMRDLCYINKTINKNLTKEEQ